ncbi:MAG TPA: hypothetical protein VIR29_12630 [Anseongella sp.]
MSQVPFTPEGVQQKLGELYNLSDAQLLAQAQQLNMNLRPWVEENFELNAAQKKYLSKVPEEILFTWGAQFAAAIANRGTITMEPLPDYSSHQAERSNGNGANAAGDGRTKEIKVKDEGETDYKPDDATSNAGLSANSMQATSHKVSIEWKLL